MDILRFLRGAAQPADFELAAALWRRTTLTIAALAPVDFDDGPSLPHRLRGAWGHALLAMEDDEWQAARRIFFAEHGQWKARAELPKPFVIQSDRDGTALILHLSLFGIADRWRQTAFDAFIHALETGIALGMEPGSRRLPLEILSADWTRSEGLRIARGGESVRLLFRTPLRIGPRHALGQRYPDIIVSLAERGAGMALWQLLAVDPDLSAWRELAKKLEFRDDELRPVTWQRRSGAQGGREIPMGGYIGALDILRPPLCLLPVLTIGESIHVGGGAALGLGRYELL